MGKKDRNKGLAKTEVRSGGGEGLQTKARCKAEVWGMKQFKG